MACYSVVNVFIFKGLEMSEWQDKSDFEINKLVSDLLDFDGLIPFFNDKQEVVYLCDKNGVDSIYPVRDFNPCNNPSDAWCLMLENGIAPISSDGRLEGATTDSYEYFEPHGNIIYHCEDKNPLRAAMIVYLMMNEANNATN